MHRAWSCLSALDLLICRRQIEGGPPEDVGDPIHYDVGVGVRELTTDSSEAQLWSDRGIGLCFGFSHEEAVHCFEKAAEADPGCAMAYWGKTYALGPNSNSPVPDEVATRAALDALGRAAAATEDETPVEKAWARSDTEIPGSCFCRTQTAAA